uniref:Uncharacterized protein n=1 Tax=Brassica oleracea TaxID=3712 RepID=A0A3P6C6J6_BRAOL|nr:unnamed protein product [Brassica oleracea]
MGSGALVLGCNTRTSREVTHPSSTLAQARLTAETSREVTHPNTTLAQTRLMRSSDGIRCISAARLRTKTAEFGPEKLPPYSPPFMVSGPFRNGAMGDVVPHGSKVMRFPRVQPRGLPRRSPILVLLSPKHSYLLCSDGIQCIRAGMIAPVTRLRVKTAEFGPEKLPPYSPPFMVSGPFRNGAMDDVVPHGSKVMSTLSCGVLMRSGALVLVNGVKKASKQPENRLGSFLRPLTFCSPASRLMALRKHQKQPENPIGILFYVPYLSAARLRVKTAEFGPEKLPSLFTALYGFWAFPKWCYGRRSSSRVKTAEFGPEKLPPLFTALYGFWAFPKWGATRGLPGRSPILVLLSPKHA